jgi:LemA protein
MDPLLIVLLSLLALIAISVVAFVAMYNTLVRFRNQVKNAWSQIDVQLKRRHDLIPNLVETVRGYAAHEKSTLENVIQARNQASAASGVADRMAAEQGLSGALGRLMMVAEQYPDLQANQNFLALQEELTSTENKIGFSRQLYNDNVLSYNNKTETFPSNLVSNMFHFRRETYFELEDPKERHAPQVVFGT